MPGKLLRFAIVAVLLVLPALVRAEEPELVAPGGGRFDIGGYGEIQLRGLSDGFDANNWYLSQWAWVLNLEPEWNIAPDGFGPFDQISAFARIEIRYDCVWSGCGLANSWRHFGDRATRAPARNWGDGLTERFEGGLDLPALGIPVRRIQSSNEELRNILSAQHTARSFESGVSEETLAASFGPLIDDLFTYKRVSGVGVGDRGDTLALPLGPWRPESRIDANGSLAELPSYAVGLPFRPTIPGRYVPSAQLRRHLDDFGSFDQNFRQTELEWNHGASQDEWELKEAFVDVELFDSQLWIRAGKQNIVWGKTELFRTTDQFNPVDIALASLPSLEESRIALWSLRGIWSFYDVGPLQDVRLELAMNFDDFQPIDLGRCGEPYAVWLVCGKSTALWAHGATGIGIAGEVRPPDPWDSARGIEFGARLEFRWGPMSFALTDFYGYDDLPAVELFHSYSRNVDPRTGAPLDVYGQPLREDTALADSSANRQIFEAACSASLGFGAGAAAALTGGMGTVPDLSDDCFVTASNIQDPFIIQANVGGLAFDIEATFANAAGAALAGQFGGNLLVDVAVNGIDSALNNFLGGTAPAYLVPLNVDPADGPKGGGLFGTGCTLGALCSIANTSNVSMYLTDQQEALIGCGPLFRTDCDVEGLDLFNAEGSVIFQSWPGFEQNPVATRYENGKLFILPGARGPGDPGYDPRVDGTPPKGYKNEMAAVSANFATFTALAGKAEGDTDCELDRPETCGTVRGFIATTGSQRPEVRAGGNGRFGRRDFLWHSGGEALFYYPKRNVLGLSFDFAEDVLKTNWGVELTWVNDVPFASNTSRNQLQETDVYNLTVSVDRPTFVNFLNANRTFFFNAQLFVRYLPHFDSSYDTNGPLTALGTFAITTGYFQDRLLPSLVLIHDLKSASGGVIVQVSYRFNESFSATVGMLTFYGQPRDNQIPFYPIALPNTNSSTDHKLGTRYEGLSAIAERDEVFLSLRYTF
jgi:hypothetical protein